jgi:metallo-beta-lactamase family protein
MMANETRFYFDIMQAPTEVTGSFNYCTLHVNDETIKFAVDCGMYQEKGYDEQNLSFPVNPKELDFAILTHNHVDHSGRFPYLVRKGFNNPIYTTVATSRILGKAFEDNLKVMRDTSQHSNNGPLYDEDDLLKTLSLVEPCEYLEPIVVNDHITLHFLWNGHLIGAASVLIHFRNGGGSGIWILFTGDYNNKNVFFPVPPYRSWIKQIPNLTVVCESTYGLMKSSEIEYTFENNIIKALRDGKTIVIPAFSLGRSQEILQALKDMQISYAADFKEIPVYFDGKLAFFYTKMYRKLWEEEQERIANGNPHRIVNFYWDKVEFLPKNLQYVDDKSLRNRIIEESNQKIIVTTSGMGSYGPAQTYIPAYIQRKKALIHFTGYCAEGTLGRRLKDAEIGDIVRVGGLDVEKAGNVEFTNEFTAHAKADELIEYLLQFESLDTVLINHGSNEAKAAFAKRVIREVKPKHVGRLGDGYIFRIDESGFVKQFSTEFK